MRSYLWILMALPLALSGCGDGHAGHDHGDQTKEKGGAHAHAPDGPHGGHLIELGTVAHLEMVHDTAAGKVTAYFFGADGESVLAIPGAPELKLVTHDGPKVLRMEPVASSDGKASEFSVVDHVLEHEHLEGRITVEIEGQTYNPDLEAGAHDHE